MRHNHLFASSALALGLCVVWATAPAQAQPDINNAPKGENPPNWNWNPGGRVENQARLGGWARQPLTPEQMRQLRTQLAEQKALTIKQRLGAAGFTDEELQTAIANEYKTQDIARGELQDKWQKITQALRANATPEAEMTTMLKEFREAVAKEKARRQAAAATLETQFKISQKPALDALLMTLGITGDEADLVGQLTVNGLTQLLPLNGIMDMADGNALPNLQLRYFTLPKIPKLEKREAPIPLQPRYLPVPNGVGGANGAPLQEKGQVLIPIPQPELPQLHLFEDHDNAMPNAAPPANTPLPKFF